VADEEFSRLIDPLARYFFGEPNAHMSSKGELRFGHHGSLSVDLKKGTWYDHERQVGGGALDLVRDQKGFSENREALGWLEAQGFTNSTGHHRANGSAGSPGTEVAHYDYVDEAGSLVFQVVRYEPKTFRQRRPDGAGGWNWSIAGARAVPYRLPELTEALANENTVFIVEGEKDADNLWRLKVPATTNAMGAGKWRTQLNQFFIDANVVIIADNDPQQTDKAGKALFHPDGRPRFAGQDHANAIAAELLEHAAKVRVLDLGKLWPECPLKGDISDWIAAGGTADQLYEIIERLPPWSAPSPGDPTRRPTPYTLPDPVTIPRRAWLHGGHYIRQATTATVAPGGFGKTTLTIYEALQMVGEGLRVWYLSGEDPKVELDRRIAAHCQHHGTVISRLPGRLFVDDRETFILAMGKSARPAEVAFDEASIGQFESAIRNDGIDAVILDPFVAFHSVSENDNIAIDQIVRRLTAIAFRTNCCIEISHHVRKPVAGIALTVDDARGGSAIINAVRSARVINRMSQTEAGQAKITKERRGYYFRVDKGKANMAPPEHAQWFQMFSEHLPNGDNVQAIASWEFPTLFGEVTLEDTEWVRGLVRAKAYRADQRSDEWLGIEIARRLQLNVADKDDCIRISKIIGVWLMNGVFKKMEMKDRTRQRRVFYVAMSARADGEVEAPSLPLIDDDDE
jgi:hypothetical protein